MPIEIHPFLPLVKSNGPQRIIIGTFPVHSLTCPRTIQKMALMAANGDMDFYYGSSRNRFWSWYDLYLAPIILGDKFSIIQSLLANDIEIADVITKCTRVRENALDANLVNITWNVTLGERLYETPIKKIICTSKSKNGAMGWLRDKILVPNGFSINIMLTNALHNLILEAVGGANYNVNPIATVMQKEEKVIEIVSLPSPGSPYRQLHNFGYNGIQNRDVFLSAYLTSVFNWF